MKLIKINNSTYINEDDICRIYLRQKWDEYSKYEFESLKVSDPSSPIGYHRIYRYRNKETNELVTEEERDLRTSEIEILLRTKYQERDITYTLSYNQFKKLGIELPSVESLDEIKTEIE